MINYIKPIIGENLIITLQEFIIELLFLFCSSLFLIFVFEVLTIIQLNLQRLIVVGIGAVWFFVDWIHEDRLWGLVVRFSVAYYTVECLVYGIGDSAPSSGAVLVGEGFYDALW